MHFVHWAEKAWPGLAEWMRTGERDYSTDAIVDMVCGIPCGRILRECWPQIPSDYARCVALLRSVPSIVPHLGQLSRVSTQWAVVVELLRKELAK